MKKEITPSFAVIASLIGLGTVGAAVATNQAVASGQNEPTTATQTAPATAPVAAATPAAATPSDATSYDFAYKGPVFSSFVAESYQQAPDPNRPEFYAWMQNSYDRSGVRFKGMEQDRDLDSVLAAIREKYVATTDPNERALLEKQTGAFCHKMIKKTVKHFNLDHGFEFYEMVDRNQRQCFLQSTVIASLMEKAGMNAGVVMVTKSDKGEESNNGHAVVLVKLSNGNDLLVDASHKTPFIQQQGLMVASKANGTYQFLAPQYAPDGDQITGYAAMNGTNQIVPTATTTPLSIAFMRSQFDYYRGERTPGGFFAKKKSDQGLADSERFFTRSIQEDPMNPLPAYALGRVELRLGQNDEAKRQFLAAYQLYDHAGFVPQGEHEALGLVNADPQALTMR